MKMTVNAVAIVVCGIILLFGYQHWKEKLAAHANIAAEKLVSEEKVSAKEQEDISHYTKNLPPALAEKIQKASKTEKTLHLVIAGSKATGTDASSWPMMFKKKLDETYGSNVFTVTVKQYPEMNTTNWVSKKLGTQLANLHPDIILFQPPMIEDNGLIGLQNTLTNLGTILKEMKGTNPDTTLILQPPNPLYQAAVYPGEITELQKFAKNHHILYLDHWKAWPASQSPELLQYMEKDRITPNEKGQQLWATFLSNYFIAE